MTKQKYDPYKYDSRFKPSIRTSAKEREANERLVETFAKTKGIVKITKKGIGFVQKRVRG